MKRFVMLVMVGIFLVPVVANRAFAIMYADSFAFPVTPVASGDRNQNPLLDGWTGYGVGATGADCGHLGQDYYLSAHPNQTAGKPIYAIANGTVFEVVDNNDNTYGWCNSASHGWGRVIVIKHTAPPGTTFSTAGAIVSLNYIPGDPRYPGSTPQHPSVVYSLYGHIDNDVRVTVGHDVVKGQLIGFIGSPDEEPWPQPHLHLEIKPQEAVDAGVWIKNDCVTATLSATQACGVHGVGSGYSYITNYAPDHYRPGNFIPDNSVTAFQCQYVDQWVDGVNINEMTGTPGTTFTLAVAYKNTGSATWQNTGGTGNQNYVELRSVQTPAGTTTDSWFDPIGWLNGRQRVVACAPASVPGNGTGTATFTFQAKIPDTMLPGDYPVYFGPFHDNSPQAMSDWGGLYWLVHVQLAGPCASRTIPKCWDPPHNGTHCVGPASAANVNALPDLTTAQWQSVGQPVTESLKPGSRYSIGLDYRSATAADLKLTLGGFNPVSRDAAAPIGQSVLPAGSEWRTFWSAPFQLTEEQLRQGSNLRLVTSSAAVEIRNVRIAQQ